MASGEVNRYVGGYRSLGKVPPKSWRMGAHCGPPPGISHSSEAPLSKLKESIQYFLSHTEMSTVNFSYEQRESIQYVRLRSSSWGPDSVGPRQRGSRSTASPSFSLCKTQCSRSPVSVAKVRCCGTKTYH